MLSNNDIVSGNVRDINFVPENEIVNRREKLI